MLEDNSNKELNCFVLVITLGGLDWIVVDVVMYFLKRMK